MASAASMLASRREVGFGKTYEALAVVSHLCAHAAGRRNSFERALVLCKPAQVLFSWEEETSSTRAGRGFPRYLPAKHRPTLFGNEVRCIDNRATARELRHAGVRGQRVDSRVIGFRLASTSLTRNYSRRKSGKPPPSSQDLAHSLGRRGRGRGASLRARQQTDAVYSRPMAISRTMTQPSLGFDRDPPRSPPRRRSSCSPARTREPAGPREVDPAELGKSEAGLQNFVQGARPVLRNQERSPSDPLRQQQVGLLQRLRDDDALNSGASDRGLQALLRRFLIRNTKKQNERRYFSRRARTSPGFENGEIFAELDENLQHRVRRSPLIPFEGGNPALFYLELRELIQEVTERARDGETTRTFIPTDLRQGLSSYRQIATSDLLNRDLESAGRLRRAQSIAGTRTASCTRK